MRALAQTHKVHTTAHIKFSIDKFTCVTKEKNSHRNQHLHFQKKNKWGAPFFIQHPVYFNGSSTLNSVKKEKSSVLVRHTHSHTSTGTDTHSLSKGNQLSRKTENQFNLSSNAGNSIKNISILKNKTYLQNLSIIQCNKGKLTLTHIHLNTRTSDGNCCFWYKKNEIPFSASLNERPCYIAFSNGLGFLKDVFRLIWTRTDEWKRRERDGEGARDKQTSASKSTESKSKWKLKRLLRNGFCWIGKNTTSQVDWCSSGQLHFQLDRTLI